MTTSAITFIVLAVFGVAAYGAYLAALVRSDGSRLARRELPPSHEPDLFEARPNKYELFDPATGSTRLA